MEHRAAGTAAGRGLTRCAPGLRAETAVGGLAALAVVAGCLRPPPPAPSPQATLTVRVGAVPGRELDNVLLQVEGVGTLRLRPAAGGLDRALTLPPGPHRIELRSSGAAWGPLLPPVEVDLAPDTAAEARFQLGPDAESRVAGPWVASLVSSRTSVAVGERVALSAQLEQPGRAIPRWSVTPPECGRLSPSVSGAVTLTALAAGTCRVSVAAGEGDGADRRSVTLAVRSRGVAFPLRPAADGVLLEDATGAPFLIKGETAWLALVNLDESEQEAYLADRGAKGFNLVEVMLLNHDYTEPPNPVPPRNRHGEQPFRRPADFSTPEDGYFRRARAFVDRAARHGIAVLLAPVYLGFDGGKEGWWAETLREGNTAEVLLEFGRSLGALFRDATNVLWLAGGDFAPPPGSEGERRHLAVLQGIREAGARQPWAGHWNFQHQGGISTDQALFAPAMALNGVYRYAQVWNLVRRAAAVVPPRPVFLLESTYEHEHPGSVMQPFRKAWWWSMLSGASGVLWSNLFLWMCESSRGRYQASYGDADGAVSSWRQEWESPGTHQMLHLHGFFEALPWSRLRAAGTPRHPAELVVSGQGPREEHIAAAVTPEADLVVAYVASTGRSPRRFALDLSGMEGAACARWYDPASGAFVHRWLVARPGREVTFETPGPNASGWNDWALVVEGARRCAE